MAKNDVITISGISAYGFHGVLDFERANGQQFVVDVELTVDLRKAGKSDDINATVEIAGEPLNLIEALAERIAKAILRNKRIRKVMVRVHKPQAPIAVPFQDVSVQIVRKNS
jgi:dihydroneopterin aldolase